MSTYSLVCTKSNGSIENDEAWLVMENFKNLPQKIEVMSKPPKMISKLQHEHEPENAFWAQLLWQINIKFGNRTLDIFPSWLRITKGKSIMIRINTTNVS